MVFPVKIHSVSLLGAGVFGDGLCTFADSVFSQFTGEEQSNGGLDFPGGDGGPLIVVSKAGSFSSDTFENVIDKAVHDGHSFAGDTSIGVNLFQHLVDVDGV